MKSLTTILMKGLAAVLPIGLTLYAVWWLARTAEGLMRGAITLFVPPERYWPGMGILAGLLLLFAIGSLVNAYIVRRAIAVWEEFLGRIPLVKTVYSAVRDVTRLLPSGEGRRDLQSVVVWRVGEARFLGFVTRDDLPELEKQAGGVDLVAVYFPLSYMLGGVTVYLPKTAVEHIDMPVEAAMRLALTGGMATAAVGAGSAAHDRARGPGSGLSA
ncbi:MAG TPA: DUF502 domain-containing protein [Steroidobacteraceae bacterium]|nr:DUF502 domain-containing protein [Steroidobacteraceae bacterium]